MIPEKDAGTEDDWGMVRSIESAELSSLLEGYGEFALDAMLDEGVLREIPVVGSIVGVAKAGRSIRDMLYLKKLLGFLKGIETVPYQQRRAALEDIRDPKERVRLGQNMLMLLDRVTDVDKPRFMANAFRAFLERTINRGTLERLYHALDHMNLRMLGELEQVYGDSVLYNKLAAGAHYLPQSEELQQLALCGLMRFEFGHQDYPDQGPSNGGFGTCTLGKIFHDVVVHGRDCDLLRHGPDIYPEHMEYPLFLENKQRLPSPPRLELVLHMKPGQQLRIEGTVGGRQVVNAHAGEILMLIPGVNATVRLLDDAGVVVQEERAGAGMTRHVQVPQGAARALISIDEVTP